MDHHKEPPVLMTRTRTFLAAVVVTVLLAACGVAMAAVNATPVNLFGSTVPANTNDPDTQAVTLGLRFEARVAGNITGVRFYKGARNTGTHTGLLYSATGAQLKRQTFTSETTSGWQSLTFTTPLTVAAGQTFTAAYRAPRGRYAEQHPYPWPVENESLRGTAGTYRYGALGYPTQVWEASNYFVDVTFEPAGTPTPTSTTSTTSTPTPTTSTTSPTSTTSTTTSPTSTTSTTTSPTSTTTTPPPGGGTLREIDGGPSYYSRWARNAGMDAPGFFPAGVWFESILSQGDVNVDKAAGLNLYVALTANSNAGLAAANNMQAWPQISEWLTQQGPGVTGWSLGDEHDMIYGPGWGSGQGYTTMQRALDSAPVGDGRLHYANYGKGVTFWETDAEAAVFVNRFQDVVSADNYWFTDQNICGQWEGGALILNAARALTPTECRRASNYGATVDRVRELLTPAGSKPVFNFVEVGGPFSENTTAASYIDPPQVRSAVWSGIIHGARGTIYFNHSFAGPCQTQHALRESCYSQVRAVVTAVNAQVSSLAPVLNSPFADGYVTVAGAVDVMAKRNRADGVMFVFAGSKLASTQAGGSATFTLTGEGDGTVTVVGEGRTLPLVGGRFTDSFVNGDAVHIYQVG